MATEIKLHTLPSSGRWTSVLELAFAVFLESRLEFKDEGLASFPEYIEATSLLGSALQEEFKDVDDTKCNSAVHWVKVALGDLQDGIPLN